MSTKKTPKHASQALKHGKDTADLDLEQAKKKKEMEWQQEVQPEIDRIEKMMAPIDVRLPSDVISLWEYSVHFINESAVSQAKAGVALLKLRQEMNHALFLDELGKRDIKKSTAYNVMSVAKALLILPDKNFQALGRLGGTKLTELARLPDETFLKFAETEYLDGKSIDDIDRMSVRELQELGRHLREEAKSDDEVRKKQLAVKDEKINDLERLLKKDLTGDAFKAQQREKENELHKALSVGTARVHKELTAIAGILSAIAESKIDFSESLEDARYSAVLQPVKYISDLCAEFGIAVNVDDVLNPEWMKETIEAEQGA